MRAIMTQTIKTRFAPSPTGYMHLGNARTALFSAVMARHAQGIFLLRIEDTDPQRSTEAFRLALEEDLRWLGLDWQEGPDADPGPGHASHGDPNRAPNSDGGHGPYCQSERQTVYDAYYTRLVQAGLAYPCFCSSEELALSRKLQRARGQAPRYSGKCRHLSAEEVADKRRQGLTDTLRFRVPAGAEVVFEDLVRGSLRFATDDIGDFIIRRADGTPAFFFSNALDDALMGVTHVLRGEDHLTNTPRQQLLLEALALPVPRYGHIALILGDDGAPLSKRNGSRSVRDLRAAGYLAGAIVNYLARLGHHYGHDEYADLTRLAAEFDPDRLARTPAHFNEAQLLFWQKAAVAQSSDEALWDWLDAQITSPTLREQVPAAQRSAFVQAIRDNIVLPADAAQWAAVIFTDELAWSDAVRATLRAAGGGFFLSALEALTQHGTAFRDLANAVKQATGCKGKALFMPLRAALTARHDGPEMGRLLPLMGVERAARRLQAAAALAASD